MPTAVDPILDMRRADGRVLRSGACSWSIAIGLMILAATGSAALAQAPADLGARVRSLVGAGQFVAASAEIDDWLRDHPEDLEARGWRARVWAWSNRWPEAEREYRDLLGRAPSDVDLIAGLADVLAWQRRTEDALALLDRACAIAPDRADIRLRRAQMLQQLGRVAESRAAYEATLVMAPTSPDAKRALMDLRGPGRHHLRVGSDLDRLTGGRTGVLVLTSVATRWNDRWSSTASFGRHHRFGIPATQGAVSATRRFGAAHALTAGVAVAGDQDVVPRTDVQVEYGRGIRGGPTGFVRGVELTWRQRWLVYTDARVVLLTPAVLVYLPNGWSWLTGASANRVRFETAGSTWQASAWTRLTVPLRPSLDGFVTAAGGAEDYASRDEILGFSARSVGAGATWRVGNGHEVSGYVQHQRRSTGQTQTSVGAGYGLRF